MPSLLLEIFSEEIPARMQVDATGHLQQALKKALQQEATMFVTPRRLAAIIHDLPEKQPDISEEIKGPKVGAPEAALAGFLKKTGLTQDQLVEKNGVYFATIEQKGRPTVDVIKETVEKILSDFPWPKSMRWGAGETAWVRPLHSILCVFDGKVVPVEFAGITAGNITRGHRFLSPDTITITDASQYEAALEKAYVVANREKRKALIAAQLQGASDGLGVKLHEDTGLLEEVTGLVEYPVVLAGKIDDSVMDLPEEVLILEMKNHQKYFATRDKAGKLSPYFLITSNMKTADEGKVIVAGNERVLRARFADGRFFYDQDRKTKLEEWATKLEHVTYHAKLGSVADKARRVEAISLQLLNTAKKNDEVKNPFFYEKAEDVTKTTEYVKRAAQLCKSDLPTGMVGEFPELQGVMGRYYAIHQGEALEVADAIRDHYKPQGSGDSVPTMPVSICVALADKFDTLISMFAIDERPTGSKDPFALRRAALGVIRIILENNIRLPLTQIFVSAPLRDIATHMAHEKLIAETKEQLKHPRKIGKYLTVNEIACSDIPEGAVEALAISLLNFFYDRLIVQLKDDGIRHDIIKAVIAHGDDDLVRVVAKAKALQHFLATEDGANLLAAYKRAANILAIEEKKDKITYPAEDLQMDVLEQPEEKSLAAMLNTKQEVVTHLLTLEGYEGAMKKLAELRRPLDAFFDKILVNDKENMELRANRLRLLASICDTMDTMADFSKIEG